MCEFFIKIVDVKTEFLNALMTQEDFIANENGKNVLRYRERCCVYDE